MLTAIVGINWGDEGKGRMVDLLSRDQQIVVRYQGDHSSEHTVVNGQCRYILNLLPTGILHPNVVSVIGNGVAVDPCHLENEIDALLYQGVTIGPENLKISDRCPVILPYHIATEQYELDRRGADVRKTCGVSMVFGDKALNMAIRMGDLLHPEFLRSRLERFISYKSTVIQSVYGKEPIDIDEIVEYATHYGEFFKDYICDTGEYLTEAASMGMDILFEAPQGALRDVDLGAYPYTASSSTVAAYATIGAGVPGLKLDKTIGVLKAFSSMVGEGPFVSELFDEKASHLMETGNEAAEKVTHIHRIGAFDAVASRYGVRIQGADELALTKLDSLSYMDKIPVCVAYEIDGVRTDKFPIGADLERAKPIFEYVDGWNCDISECRTPDDLPVGALTYVKYLEQLLGCRIAYVSVGAERNAYVKL